MPGWHEATREFRADGRLQLAGIIQEQHPERARLFMQWKEMDWPILVDALDLLDVAVVPITLLVDEQGVIRHRVRGRHDPREVVASFLADRPTTERVDSPAPSTPDLNAMREKLDESSARDWREYGEALTLWAGDDAPLDEAIDAFRRSLALDPADAHAAFRLGVALRMRYDSPRGTAEDFTAAVASWTRARELDPNNYIWMRRLQQYGPRLSKPYPFYDWVDAAQEEIRARGETPVALSVRPRGAELAKPAKQFDPAAAAEQPAHADRIHRDAGKFVAVEALTVPLRIDPGGSARVHLDFRPVASRDAHWNNEGDRMVLWIDPPEGWQVDRRRIDFDYPSRPTSDETRHFEFEVQSPAAARPATLRAYALYHVCEGIQGQCLFRRQDLEIALDVAPADGE